MTDKPTLRKDSFEGGYILTGPLSELGGPGRRTVEALEIRGIAAGDRQSLKGVDAFEDLRELSILDADQADLAPLAATSLERFELHGASGCDLSPLGEIDALQELVLDGARDCRAPARLPSLRTLVVLERDGSGAGGSDIAAFVDSVDWSSLTQLRDLTLSCEGAHPQAVDLSFLAHLPNLERLDLLAGPPHKSGESSPLEPPFDGLSKNLRWIRFAADGAEKVATALRFYLMLHDPSDNISVFERAPAEEGVAISTNGPWEPFPYDDDDGWGVYGSLCEAWSLGPDEVEYDAAEDAEQRLHETDETRAGLIEFDPEAGGTAIRAQDRADLEWALGVLGLR